MNSNSSSGDGNPSMKTLQKINVWAVAVAFLTIQIIPINTPAFAADPIKTEFANVPGNVLVPTMTPAEAMQKLESESSEKTKRRQRFAPQSPLSPPDQNEKKPPQNFQNLNQSNIINVYPGDSIQEAIDQSNAGDIIRVHGEEGHEYLERRLTLKEHITVEGVDNPVLNINDNINNSSDAVQMKSNSVLRNFTIYDDQTSLYHIVFFDFDVSNALLENNTLLSGIVVQGSENTIQHNDIRSLMGTMVLRGGQNLVYKNLLISTGPYNGSGGQTYQQNVAIDWDPYQSRLRGGNIIDGNTIIGWGESTALQANGPVYSIGISNSDSSGNTIVNNIIHNSSKYSMMALRSEDDVRYNILDIPPDAEVQIGMGVQIGVDPLFANESSHDYHLQSGSPAIDAGDPNTHSDPDGTRADIGAYFFDQSPPPLPAGWTRAASNLNFAFRVFPEQYYDVLQLRNLQTGEQQNLERLRRGYERFEGLRDVSPDGLSAVYGVDATTSDPSYEDRAVVYDIAAKKILRTFDGQFLRYRFIGYENSNTVNRIAVETKKYIGQTLIGHTRIYRVNDGKIVNNFYRILKAGSNTHIDEDAQAVIVTARGASGNFEAVVFDSSEGPYKLQRVHVVNLGSDTDITHHFIDARRTPSGHLTVIINFETPHGGTNLRIVNTTAKKGLNFKGWLLQNADYSGDPWAVFQLVNDIGFMRLLHVNLTTMEWYWGT